MKHSAALAFGAALAFFAAPLKAEEGQPLVFGQEYTLASEVLQQDRTIAIYVPPACTAEARCDTLYVIDGGKHQDFLPTIGLSYLGSLSGMYPAMIVVGVETLDRQNELTPPSADKEHLEAFPTLGGAADFRRFIVEEVKPFVAARSPQSGHDAVLGESLAGLFIVDTALNASESFDDYFAISPSLWWDRRAIGKEAKALVSQLQGNHLFYLTTANEGGDHQKGSEEVAAAFKTYNPKGWKWTYVPRPDQEHSTIYHGASLDALRWAYGEREKKR